MAEFTDIPWTDSTFNPWWGCTKVSPGCLHCYAESLDKCYRGGRNWGRGAPRQVVAESTWREPHKWEHKAAASGKRIRVFCGSMCDVFDPEAPAKARQRLFELIRNTPNLDWQLLTKRPQNIARYLPTDWGNGWRNVWLGSTVEDQKRAAERIAILRAIPARIRFLSCEPLLEYLGDLDLRGIHWVIVAGESGGNARPFDVMWARHIQQQCASQRVAFFAKQLGACPFCGKIALDIATDSGRRDSHNGDFNMWPRELKPLMVRQFPAAVMH